MSQRALFRHQLRKTKVLLDAARRFASSRMLWAEIAMQHAALRRSEQRGQRSKAAERLPLDRSSRRKEALINFGFGFRISDFQSEPHYVDSYEPRALAPAWGLQSAHAE